MATCSSGSVERRADRRAAGVGADAVDGGRDGDLEQRLAVEVRAERLADAAQRVLQARALQAQLLERARSWTDIALNSSPSSANSSLPTVGTTVE